MKRILAFVAGGALRLVLLILAFLATTALALGDFPGHQVAAAVCAIGAVAAQIFIKSWWKRAAATLAGFAVVLA